MLNVAEKVKLMTPEELRKFVKLVELAEKLKISKDKLYGYVYRYNQRHQSSQLDTFTIPGEGRYLFLKREDAEMLEQVFSNPEDFAQKVVRRPKR